ncbi:YafY family transcriptional regulator [Frankia sp. CNm7]|uniref:YafY family transcriptional regulator n=1 Tax=Frankia nepalensis TaxID=1836974 RepID=A0A937RI51_9ACTN|nr:YafY family protein [Frankia nepalensis]MBL7499691.1 YafY family transcriptional regulator [Frankia nepalensis]MBL7515338.1 YafY family transcriptional regulator [Frankia nepalensis]MBL7517776.1 YafY family transcriptional regulator [Frankia nepalensis]MBL7626441.1 YafY family transcriptional regulator [Frankia nepalensis]
MLETSARLLNLLALLQARRDWTGPELAERLEVTTRTIRKDVERLRRLGYPVRATPGAAGGYRLDAGANVPPLLLDDEEAVAVAIGLRTAAGGTINGIEESSARALAKLHHVLPARLRRRVDALYALTVPTPWAGPSIDADVLTTLATACRDHERLRFDYETHDGDRAARDTEPHRLVHTGRRWYLVAWDLARDDWRTFRVDRVRPRTPTGPRFTPRPLPDDPEIARRVAAGAATATWRYRARVVVHAPAERVARKLPVPAAIQPTGPDECVFEPGSDDPRTLARYLAMLDEDFTVEDAPELAAELRALADRLRRAAR